MGQAVGCGSYLRDRGAGDLRGGWIRGYDGVSLEDGGPVGRGCNEFG